MLLDERCQLVMLYGLALQLMGEGRIMLKGALYKSVCELREGFGRFCLYHSRSHATLPRVYTQITLPLPSPPLPSPPYRKVSQVRHLQVAEVK